MPASQHLKLLSVRVPESEVRRVKSLAASRGISVQEAVQQALQSWPSTTELGLPEQLEALQGSLADVDVFSLMRRDKRAELTKDRRR